MEEEETEKRRRCNRRLRQTRKINSLYTDAIKIKNMGKITVVQGLLEVADKNGDCRKEKEVVDTKMRKVTDNVVASVLTKNN